MKDNTKKKIELLAPVGSYESLHAAINAGCDSIFFGITQLNMRAKAAHNFTFKDMEEIAKICHQKEVKAYLTLNTILYNHDVNLAHKIIDKVKETGIDAIIASDMAAIMYANEVEVNVHLSTQLSISNIETVKFYSKFADVVVLARELTLPMIKDICTQIREQNIRGVNGELMKVEVFGHGAMCIAVSGRCSMSLLTDNSSANRGACRQNCRRRYRVIDKDTNTELEIENDYVMSPSDLCTVGMLDELAASGMDVLKVEGRGRSADYVDRVVRTYREAIDSLENGTYTKDNIKRWNEELGTVYNRGLSGGFYMGKPFVEWSGAHGNKATKRREAVGKVKKFYPKMSVAEIILESGTISNEDEYQIAGERTGILNGNKPEIWKDEKTITHAQKGDTISIKVESEVRSGDRLYKMVPNEI
jgi:putative protease